MLDHPSRRTHRTAIGHACLVAADELTVRIRVRADADEQPAGAYSVTMTERQLGPHGASNLTPPLEGRCGDSVQRGLSDADRTVPFGPQSKARPNNVICQAQQATSQHVKYALSLIHKEMHMARGEELKFGCVVQGAASYTSKQGSVYSPGISAETAGSKAVFLGIVTIPPEGRTKAHFHEHHESAFYLMSGEEVELCTGEQLEHRETARPGDYLFIPAKVPHVAVNRGKTPAVFVGVRNEPTAQESVVLLPALDALVP